MHLHDLLDPDDLERALSAALIKIRTAPDGQRIFNYSDSALFTPGAWDNPAVRQCRGLVVDPSDRVVARPWAKFFNHSQPEAGALDLGAPVQVTDKMDGSLGIVHLDERGDLRVATRGSFASDQALHATAWLGARGVSPDQCGDLSVVTPLVEIIHPGNRIVCDYGGRDELVLLGGVVIETGEYLGPDAAVFACWPYERTEVFTHTTLHAALAAEPRPGAEGLCVRFLGSDHIVKLKQEDYIHLHRIVTGLSERSVWWGMTQGQTLGELLEPLPDELHAWTREVWDRIIAQVDEREAAARAVHRSLLAELPAGHSRGDYAARATTHGTLTPLLFQLLDDRDPRPAIVRTLKPAGDVRPRATSDAS